MIRAGAIFSFNDGFFQQSSRWTNFALKFLYFLGPYKCLGPCQLTSVCFADLHVLLLEDLLILLQKEDDKLVLKGLIETLYRSGDKVITQSI